MANALVNFAENELNSIAQHLVSLRVKAIQELKDSITPIHDLEEIRSVFVEMAKIWQEIQPAEKVARFLFPNLGWLFDLLDKIVSIESEILIAANKKS